MVITGRRILNVKNEEEEKLGYYNNIVIFIHTGKFNVQAIQILLYYLEIENVRKVRKNKLKKSCIQLHHG